MSIPLCPTLILKHAIKQSGFWDHTNLWVYLWNTQPPPLVCVCVCVFAQDNKTHTLPWSTHGQQSWGGFVATMTKEGMILSMFSRHQMGFVCLIRLKNHVAVALRVLYMHTQVGHYMTPFKAWQPWGELVAYCCFRIYYNFTLFTATHCPTDTSQTVF